MNQKIKRLYSLISIMEDNDKDFQDILDEYDYEVHIKEIDEETGLFIIEVPHKIPKEIDDFIRENNYEVRRKTSTVFEVSVEDYS